MPLTLPGGRTLPLPARRGHRRALGWGLVVGGVFGFLPVIGFWMLPLGMMVLSVDSPRIRRGRRRLVIWWFRRPGKIPGTAQARA